MSAWGPGVYQNDTALDIKDYYVDQLHRGMKSGQITEKLITERRDLLADPCDALNFWLALADTQWSMGLLLPEVKEKALECLSGDQRLHGWESAPKKLINKRIDVLDKLRVKLESPQPPAKKIPQYRLYQCRWEIGDVFSLLLDGEKANEAGLSGKYILLEKVDEGVWHPGHIIPMVYVKLADAEGLPTTVEEYNILPYLKTDCSLVDLRLVPPEEVVRVKNEYKLDDDGMSYTYRIELITTSKRSVPANLKLLGNFVDATKPQNEYVPCIKANITSVFWKELGDVIVDKYLRYNIRTEDGSGS